MRSSQSSLIKRRYLNCLLFLFHKRRRIATVFFFSKNKKSNTNGTNCRLINQCYYFCADTSNFKRCRISLAYFPYILLHILIYDPLENHTQQLFLRSFHVILVSTHCLEMTDYYKMARYTDSIKCIVSKCSLRAKMNINILFL